MEDKTFTKEEIWGAVLELGGKDDLTEGDLEEGKQSLFKVLDAVAANRESAKKLEAEAEEKDPVEEKGDEDEEEGEEE